MTVDKPDTNETGASGAPLAPVVDFAAWQAQPDISALPILAPAPVPAIDQAVLGEILADSLFGDVIELSDLISGVTTPGGATAADQGAEAHASLVEVEAFTAVPLPSVVDGDGTSSGEQMEVAGTIFAPFTILFEEDGSSGYGTL